MKLLMVLLASLVALSNAALADDSNIEKMSLQDVYGLSESDIEAIVLSNDKEVCDELISSVTQGENDPAQLSPAQFCAIQNYSNGRFSINKQLWQTDSTGSALNGNDWAYVRVLDSALAKIKSTPLTTVYRGASSKDIKFTKPGQIVRLKGYTSTTPSRDVAEGFVQDRLMVLKITSGKNIKPYSNAGSEDELLLPRSTYVRFDRSEIKTLDLFTEDGPEKRKVEIVYLTEVQNK